MSRRSVFFTNHWWFLIWKNKSMFCSASAVRKEFGFPWAPGTDKFKHISMWVLWIMLLCVTVYLKDGRVISYPNAIGFTVDSDYSGSMQIDTSGYYRILQYVPGTSYYNFVGAYRVEEIMMVTDECK